MNEKVKVSCEVAKVLDEIRTWHEPTIDDFIKCHVIGNLNPDWQILKQYRTLFVSHLIYTGDYEFQETPEEKIFEVYSARNESMQDQAFNQGIKYTLDTLNIRIKGINE